jgi:serine/threonine protein kinase
VTKLTKLGRYEIIREIGRGGMATVYLARDPVFERDVALKLLPREFLHDPTFIARFEREAKAIANIEHSAIVPVYDFGEEEGQPFLVLRYMIGGSMSDRLKEELLSLEEAEKIISRLAKALSEAHRRGMIHRDIKPGNVLFDQYGDAFLTDFGIVKLTQETSTYTGGAIVGTPTYMSPEQARGDRDIDARSDVYALGAMLFEMLTGRPPYQSETFMGLAIKHINDPIPSILDLNPDLPADLDEFIQRAMCKDREGRYNNVLELAEALTEILKPKQSTFVAEPLPTEVVESEETFETEPTVVAEPMLPEETVEPDAEFEPTVVEKVKPSDEIIEIDPEPTIMAEAEPVEDLKTPAAEPEATVVEVAPPMEVSIPPKDEVEPTVLEEPKKEDLEKPEIMLDSPDPKTSKKPFKLPKWAVPVGGIILVGALLGIFLPSILKPSSPTATPTSEAMVVSNTATPSVKETPLPEPSPLPSYPPVVGEDPSPDVGAFYYPWYGSADIEGDWYHWQDESTESFSDILSDYYPILEPYSSMHLDVIAQHFAWLRQAGVGFIVSSWWGENSHEDKAVPLLLEMGERYGIKVAFHLEPYEGFTPEQLVHNVRYLYETYGDHPAFYRTTESKFWIQDDRPKGLFFLREPTIPFGEEDYVDYEYWLGAIDEIHNMPDGGIVIAETLDAGWLYFSQFDGIYNYALLEPNFDYAVRIPMYSWYVPGVIPGFSCRRVGCPDDLYLPRDNGETYNIQWQAALFTSTRPDLVIISSFNQWHEGTQIEPAAPGFETDEGRVYEGYEGLGPEDYLYITKEFAHHYQTAEWPPEYRVQIQMVTTSDWTDFLLVEGGRMLRPFFRHISDGVINTGLNPNHLYLHQELTDAFASNEVEIILDVLITDLDPEGVLVFEIERGHEGWTEVNLMNFVTDEPVRVDTFLWGGINEGPRNAIQFEIPASLIVEPPS